MGLCQNKGGHPKKLQIVTEKHKRLLEDHGWTKYYNVDLLDATGPDLEVDISNGKII